MPVLQIEAQVSSDELLKAAIQLGASELDQFTRKVLAINAQRKAPSLSQDESMLFVKINQGISNEMQQRYASLIERRDEELLTADEYAELLNLTKITEEYDAQRMDALIQLAKLRNIPLRQLMVQLNLTPRDHA